MTPERRCEALGEAPEPLLERLADTILESARVQVVAGPEVVTAAVRLPVPGTGSTFVVGHVVVTTCQVELDGTRGDGVVQGRALRAALAAAICDAEAERGGPLAQAVDALVEDVEHDRAERLADEARAVALTRLDDDGSAS
jgi:alpha-D-ribose 1-methylphosphonate 5-triphosphate synthase subunit PhnG